MSSNRIRERGEGQIGCVVTLLVLASAIAVGVKVVPVFYDNYNLQDFAQELAGKAGLYPLPALQLQLQDKAKELGIPEAMAKGAMTISTTGEASAGVCTIQINFKRTIDLYGVYPLVVETHKTIVQRYMDAR